MFLPKRVLYEKDSENYELGQYLLNLYRSKGIKCDVIENIEIGTSPLKVRVEAINKLKQADYKVGILIAPVIFLENWKKFI